MNPNSLLDYFAALADPIRRHKKRRDEPAATAREVTSLADRIERESKEHPFALAPLNIVAPRSERAVMGADVGADLNLGASGMETLFPGMPTLAGQVQADNPRISAPDFPRRINWRDPNDPAFRRTLPRHAGTETHIGPLQGNEPDSRWAEALQAEAQAGFGGVSDALAEGAANLLEEAGRHGLPALEPVGRGLRSRARRVAALADETTPGVGETPFGGAARTGGGLMGMGALLAGSIVQPEAGAVAAGLLGASSPEASMSGWLADKTGSPALTELTRSPGTRAALDLVGGELAGRALHVLPRATGAASRSAARYLGDDAGGGVRFGAAPGSLESRIVSRGTPVEGAFIRDPATVAANLREAVSRYAQDRSPAPRAEVAPDFTVQDYQHRTTDGPVSLPDTGPGAAHLPPWETRGAALPELYHGGDSHVAQPERSYGGRRRPVLYGEGFYTAEHPDVSRKYGETLTRYRVDPSSRVLNVPVHPEDAPAELVERIAATASRRPDLRTAGGEPVTGAGLRGHGDPFGFEWASAANAYAEEQGYDIVRWTRTEGPTSYNEVVVKNPGVLSAGEPQGNQEAPSLLDRVTRPLRNDTGATGDTRPQLPPLPERTADHEIAALRASGAPADVQRADNLERFMDGSAVRRVVYHGTNKDFEAFAANPSARLRQGHAWDRLGIWFTDEPRIASNFADRSWRGEQGGSVYPVYLSLRNPLEVNYESLLGVDADQIARLRARALADGHDGIALRRFDSDEFDYVAFDPAQAKSAIGNSGAFNPSNPSLIGTSSLRPLTALSGAGLGVAGGAAADPDHPVRGAIAGGALGLAAGLGVPEAVESVGRYARNDTGATGDLSRMERPTDSRALPVPRALRAMPKGMPVEETRAWVAGEDAGSKGLARDTNPHEPGTRLNQRFDQGWRTTQRVAAAESTVPERVPAVRTQDGSVVTGTDHGSALNTAVDRGLVSPEILNLPDNHLARYLEQGHVVDGEFVPEAARNTPDRATSGNRFVAEPADGARWRVVDTQTREVREPSIGGFDAQSRATGIASRLNRDAGVANTALLRGIVGGTAGASVGAEQNEDHPVLGALGGAVAGLGVGLAPEVLQSIRRVAGNESGAVGDLSQLSAPRFGEGAGPESSLWREAMPEVAARSASASATEPTIESAEAELNAALKGNRPEIRDLVGLGTGSLSPDDFAVRYGIAVHPARSYARAAELLKDEPDPFDLPQDAATAARQPPHGTAPDFDFATAPEPRPFKPMDEGDVLRARIPDEPVRRYGSGRGQIGRKLLSQEGALAVRRASILANPRGAGRNFITGMVPTETAATALAAPVDIIASRLRRYMETAEGLGALFKPGRRSVVFSGKGTADALVEAATKGMADAGRRMLGRSVGASVGDAASGTVDAMDARVVMHTPLWDALTRTVGRIRGAVSIPAATYARARVLDELARVGARNELGTALGRDYAALVARLKASPTPPMLDAADAAVAVATFTNENLATTAMHGLQEGLSKTKYRSVNNVINLVEPFHQRPGAVAGYTAQMSPLGAFKVNRDFMAWYRSVRGNAPPEEIDALQRTMALSAGRVGTGLGLLAGGGYLAVNGQMTGLHPTEAERSQGALPFSVRIAGRWVPAPALLGPAGVLLGVGAETVKAHEGGESPAAAALEGGGGALGSEIARQTLLSGMTDTNDMLSDPEKLGEWAAAVPSSFVPTLLRDAAHGFDATRREPENLVQRVALGIPGLANRLPAKIDPATGRPVRTGRGGLAGALSSVVDVAGTGYDRASADPTQRLLSDYDVRISTPKRADGETMVQYRARQQRVGNANQAALSLLTGREEPAEDDLIRLGILKEDATRAQADNAVEWMRLRWERFRDAETTFTDWRSDPAQFDGSPVLVDNAGEDDPAVRTAPYRTVSVQDGAWEVRKKAIQDVLGRISERQQANVTARAAARGRRVPPSASRGAHP